MTTSGGRRNKRGFIILKATSIKYLNVDDIETLKKKYI
jgi:hypothetical protein